MLMNIMGDVMFCTEYGWHYYVAFKILLNIKLYLDKCQITTILDEPIGNSNMVKLSGHESKYISVLYSQLYIYLFIIYPIVQK